MDAHTEWVEGVDLGKRRVLGSTAISSSTLDEWADEFGMSSNRLLRTLQRATTVGDRESPQKMEERLMKHYRIDPKRGEEHPEAADINMATQEELQTIQGIGPKLSALIVANQPFYAISQGVLSAVVPRTFERKF
jgi:DNA uptake protein ComE-like DNA-binding protein